MISALCSSKRHYRNDLLYILCSRLDTFWHYELVPSYRKVACNIINRDFTATKPCAKWTTDVSQFNFTWGKCYLSPILDMYTNEIISYDLSLHLTLEQVSRMLNRAFEKFPCVEGLIMHSDQGWQYQNSYYIKELEKHKITQSMSRKGNCYDNCIMETFFGRLKQRCIMDVKENLKHTRSFQKQSMNIYTTITTKGFRRKQNGCHLLCIG